MLNMVITCSFDGCCRAFNFRSQTWPSLVEDIHAMGWTPLMGFIACPAHRVMDLHDHVEAIGYRQGYQRARAKHTESELINGHFYEEEDFRDTMNEQTYFSQAFMHGDATGWQHYKENNQLDPEEI